MKNLSFKKVTGILLVATLFLASCSENDEREIVNYDNDELATMLSDIELNSNGSLKKSKEDEIYITSEEESNKMSYQNKQMIVDTHNSLTNGGRMVIENSKQKLYLFTKLDNIKDNLTVNNFNARELRKSYKVTAINSKRAILPEKLTGTF